MPGAGFAAGPCLFKDTMQLAAFNNNNFALGHSAMLVNEGLPLYLVAGSSSARPAAMTVGILGMAFKGGPTTSARASATSSGGSWSSRPAGSSAPTPTSPSIPARCRSKEVLAEADLLVVATPHAEYADLGRNCRWPTCGTCWRGVRV